jgi:hypothetical protein
MKNATGIRYAIIPQGGVKEELWERQDIEALCRAGKLSPKSVVYVPDANEWKQLGDTDFAGFFAKSDPPSDKEKASPPSSSAYQDQYEAAVQQLRTNPADVGLRLSAASLALALGKMDSARDHYQEALDLRPYHPRVAQEAKRNLPPAKLKTLRCLEKPPQVWENPAAIFMYPYSRGPLYLAVPAAAIFGMFWSAWAIVPLLLVVGLWSIESMRTSARGERRAPLWDGLVADPLHRIAKPIAVTSVAILEIVAVFGAIAGLLIVTKLSDESNFILVVGKSPFLTVLAFTVGVFYVPAMLMLSASASAGLRDAANPKTVVAAIRVMEVEYVLCSSFAAVLIFLVWGVGALLGRVSWIDRVFYAVAIVYLLLAMSFMYGRVLARFRDDLERQVLRVSSDA